MSFDSGALPGTGSFRRLLRNMRRASEMSNPIRIASGPPTIYGNYLFRGIGNPSAWLAECVVNFEGVLSVYTGAGKYKPISDMKGQWSTRIPDPEDGK